MCDLKWALQAMLKGQLTGVCGHVLVPPAHLQILCSMHSSVWEASALEYNPPILL